MLFGEIQNHTAIVVTRLAKVWRAWLVAARLAKHKLNDWLSSLSFRGVNINIH
jgi:hypothetical protein